MSSTLTTVGTVFSVIAPLIFITTAIFTIADIKHNHKRDKEKIDMLKKQSKETKQSYQEHAHEGVY